MNKSGKIWLLITVLLSISCGTESFGAVSGSSIVELMHRKFTAYRTAKKESLYAISRSLKLNYDSLALWNQGIEGEVPKGYTLYLPQNLPSEPRPDILPENTIVYNVKHGDTLFGIARRYNTTVEDIISLNPRLRSSVLPAGADIKVPENSAQRHLQQVIETRQGIIAFRFHEVRKDESPEGIASAAGISVEMLRAANPGVAVKRKSAIAIPVLGPVKYIVYRHIADHRENTAEGQQAIFDSIAGRNDDNSIRVAVLLSNPQSNKDVDFSRGLLTAAREFGKGNRHTDIKFVNAAREGSGIIDNPAIQNADIIFTTYDASVPEYLADYTARNAKTLINAFAVRDTLYRDNPSIINLLSSPTDFNTQVARYIIENFGNSYIVFIGDPLKTHDQIANQVMNEFDTENFDVMEDISTVDPHPSRPMVFYSLANNKKDMKTSLDAVSSWMEAHPGVDVNTIGRPSWIVYVDAYNDELRNVHANVPSRFYFAEKDAASQQFLKRYHEFFNADPVRSYPAYSVMGYDAAWYFLRPGTDHEFLQMPFRLTRTYNGGEYNSSAFMLRYFPGMPVVKFDIVPYQQATGHEVQ